MALYVARRLCLHGFVYSLCNLAPYCVFHLGFFPSPLLCLSCRILYLCTCCFLHSFRSLYLLGCAYCLLCVVAVRMRGQVCLSALFWLIDGFFGQPKCGFFVIFQLFIGFPFPPLSSRTSGRIWIAFYQKRASRDFHFYILWFEGRGVRIRRIRSLQGGR